MRKHVILFTILSIVSFFLINCSEDEVTNPKDSGNDPTVNIVSPADGESFVEGDAITFTGTGEDFEGNALPDSVLIWTSDIDNKIGTGSSFNNDNLSLGSHVITLTGTDSKGRSDSESINVDVTLSAGFVLIPADTFTMGSPWDETERGEEETLCLITLTSDFYIYATEVTNQQYAEMAQWAYDRGYCTATSSSVQDNIGATTEELLNLVYYACEISFSGGTFTVDSGKENHPVKAVSWFGAVSYCDWLSVKGDLARAYDHSSWECNGHDPYNASGYRLPTEAEWEYACRAGTHTPFSTGECLDTGTEANYNGSPYIGCDPGSSEEWTVPVGTYPANDFGLYDMHGNLFEWCNDWYGDYSQDGIDPVGPSTGTFRVLRGGSWNRSATSCRSAKRIRYYPSTMNNYYGFRVCRSVPAR